MKHSKKLRKNILWEAEFLLLAATYLQCRRAAMRYDKYLEFTLLGMSDYAFEMKLILKEQHEKSRR